MWPPKSPTYHATNQHCPSVAPWLPAPWPSLCSLAQFWPSPSDAPQTSPGHDPGWTRPPRFVGPQRSAEGSSRRQAWLQIQCRHLQGGASLSPLPLDRSLNSPSITAVQTPVQRDHPASSGPSRDSLPSHPCGWLDAQACPHPYRDILPSTSNLQRGELRHQTFGVVVYKLFLLVVFLFFPPSFCSLSECPRAAGLSQAPWQVVPWSAGQHLGAQRLRAGQMCTHIAPHPLLLRARSSHVPSSPHCCGAAEPWVSP